MNNLSKAIQKYLDTDIDYNDYTDDEKNEIKEYIMNTCEMHKIKNFSINETLEVDVNYDVTLKNISYIPIKFGEIMGSFNISNNPIKSLKNCPRSVYEDFFCSFTNIENTKYFPNYVKGKIHLNNNLYLENIEEIKNIKKLLDISRCPKLSINHNIRINGTLDISGNNFNTLFNPNC